jgi:hypothetical protein
MGSDRLPAPAGSHLQGPRPGLLRSLLLGLLAFGAFGLVLELLLLSHWESLTMAIPFVALAAVILFVAAFFRHGPLPGAGLRLFRGTMSVVVLTGVVGIGLHLYGNVAFEREMDPDAELSALLWKGLRGGVPVLAPGAMVQLGLLGLVLSWFRPVRDARAPDSL